MPDFDPGRARSFAALLSRPRMCGTEGEAWARGQVAGALRGAGLDVSEEAFSFRPVGDALARGGVLAAAAGLALLYAGALGNAWLACAGMAWLAVLAAFGPATVGAVIRRFARDGASPLPGWIPTANVVGRAAGPPGAPLLVFVAHYDSKSQNMPITVRVGLFALLGAAGLPLAELCLSRAALGWPSPAVLHALAVPAAAAALALLTLRTGNASPGALDNASGVGALVELARAWEGHPLSWKARAWFVATSAEEHGLVGAQVFVGRHGAKLRAEGRCWIVNMDGVGAKGRMLILPGRSPESGGRSVSRALLDAAGGRARGIPTGVGLLTDHVPFVEAGLSCATVLMHAPSARRIHTARDGAEGLEDEAFREAGGVVLGAVEELLAHP
jgi:hypothetical protein